MEQISMFCDEFPETQENEYTTKIKAPIYEPKNKKPHILELVDPLKANKLINEINNSSLPEEEKKFLIEAAKRHNVFNYELIADYYAHASPDMQDLMEKSALVIIDFNKAIRYGYVKYSQEIANIYKEENGKQ